MSEKDPIEELFRKEAEETLFQDKPREVVWKKIENNLQMKTETPIKNFIQSVWFSAAVFALIAVPYFYFLLENLNNDNANTFIVKKSVENILMPEKENQDNDLETIISESPVLVKNSEKNKSKKETEFKSTVPNKPQELKINATSEESILDSSTKPILMSVNIDSALIAKEDILNATSIAAASTIDTVLLATNKTNPVKESIALRSKSPTQEISPLSFQRNRFIIQDKVTRVSFEFIRKNNNRLIFQKEGIKLTLIRDNGQVKILTNTKNIKPEILSLIQTNKELIYNYYINFEASKNK